ncbi:MAG: molybdopterin oxidoreductase family protein [Alphaproteobacteria bacterium]|jgi:anaerobic selenocysteine-containing dehydrogenase|nr:molybdopterin oxidoreductase family protein [Alphaproteobacteria bacterium]MDP6516876.1 molybdopterin oxidoreductase family protein [Alphaproteobacteria bacterium]
MDKDSPVEKVFSVCPHDCPSTCALEIDRPDGYTIGRVHGARDNSYTAGVVCAKVARYAERTHHPDRLRTPLRRAGAKGEGGFTPISWDDALDEVAEAFIAAAQRHGSETVWPYYYAGTMGLVQRDGINRLRHAMRYSGQHSTFCTTLVNAGWHAAVGGMTGPDPREMAQSDLIVAWGTNAATTQVTVMSHIQKARKKRGAKLVVVDPYRNRTAQVADIHLALRPGTDGALAAGVMHVLFRDGFADRPYMAEFTDCPERLEAHLATRTPAWAAEITGLSVAEIEAFAKLYGGTERSFIRLGYGFSRSRNGAPNVHAVACLPSVTGAWRHPGGGAFYTNGGIYHWDKTLIEGLDALDPDVRVLDQSRIGQVLLGNPGDLGDGPPVTAMLFQNTNPAVVAPESAAVNRGLARDDLFLCVHEQFATETAGYADILLPATTFVEHDDLYQGGGHQHILLGPKLIEPIGESRSNHEVLCGLAQRLGTDHPGFAMTEWEIIDATLRASGWGTIDDLAAKRWIDCQPDFETAHFLNGFDFPDRRFRFAPDWAAEGPDHGALPPLPDHAPLIEAADAEHPYRMVTAPAHNYLNTSFTETRTSIAKERRPRVKIHPDDARRIGAADGERIRVGNRRGAVTVHAELFDGLQPGVVVVEGIWPNRAFEGGVGINTLVGADPGPPNGGGVFHDTAVWLRAGLNEPDHASVTRP